MKSLRLHIARCVTLVVALQILNFGLFAQEFDPIGSSAPSEEFNIINTLVEYVAETVLQHKNAMPENNSDSKKDMQAHKHSSFKLFSIQKTISVCFLQRDCVDILTSYINNPFQRFCKEVIPPPPKA